MKTSPVLEVGQIWQAGKLRRLITSIYSFDPICVDYTDAKGREQCCSKREMKRWVRDRGATLFGKVPSEPS